MSNYKEIGFNEFKLSLDATNSQLVDIRDLKSFSEGHIRQSINIPFGPNFENFAIQLIDPQHKVILIGQSDQIEETADKLSELGVDQEIKYFKGGLEDWKANGEKLDFIREIGSDELVQRINSEKLDGVIIDIRNENETKNGHYSEAILLPMNKIRTHADKILKKEQLYYIHCAGGIRSQMAYGLLNRMGFSVVNIQQGFEGMVRSGLKKILKRI